MLLAFSLMPLAARFESTAGTLESGESFYMQSLIGAGDYHAGLFRRNTETLAFGEALASNENFAYSAGFLSESYRRGFQVSNGGYEPQFNSMPDKRPAGGRLGLYNRYFSVEGLYYTLSGKHSRTDETEGSTAFTGLFMVSAGPRLLNGGYLRAFRGGQVENAAVLSSKGRYHQLDAQAYENGDYLLNPSVFYDNLYLSARVFKAVAERPLSAGVFAENTTGYNLSAGYENWSFKARSYDTRFSSTLRYRVTRLQLYAYHRSELTIIGTEAAVYEGYSPFARFWASSEGDYFTAAGFRFSDLWSVSVYHLERVNQFLSPLDPFFYNRDFYYRNLAADDFNWRQLSETGLQGRLTAGHLTLYLQAGRAGNSYLLSLRFQFSHLF